MNLETIADLKKELAEYGYDDAKIAEGKAIYDETQRLYDKNKKETNEEREKPTESLLMPMMKWKSIPKTQKIAKVAFLMKQSDIWKV